MKQDATQLPEWCEAIQHSSDRVFCSARQEPAVISVISRTAAPGPIRYVLWCSLRGIGTCDEHCLR